MKNMNAEEAGHEVFKRAWKKGYEGMTLCAVGSSSPWVFMVVDYPFLRELSKL
jgi:hypothetical protein